MFAIKCCCCLTVVITHLCSSGYCLESARPSVSTTIRDMADINFLEEEEEEEQHSWGQAPGPGSGGDCIAAISTC